MIGSSSSSCPCAFEMPLASIEWSNVRNLETNRLTPCPGINLIHGANGSGKTSLLESIHLLGRARSFQTNQVNQLIRHGQTHAKVSGKIKDKTEHLHTAGIQISRGERELHLDGHKVLSSADLLRTFPVLVISPTSTSLLKDGPKQRRQFLDFGVFHETPEFLDTWRRYMKVLSHRNALLREKRATELEPWNRELDRYGTMVAKARQQYAENLEPFIKETAERFLPHIQRFELKTTCGWGEPKSLIQALQDETATDLRYGYTQSGPHRGDFNLNVDGRSARSYLSRGQTKLLIYALLLAQSRMMEDSDSLYSGCVLIDDIASELDDTNRARLMAFLRERNSQFFITATEKTGFLSEAQTVVDLDQGHIVHNA